MANTVASISVTQLSLNNAVQQLYTAKTTQEVNERTEKAYNPLQSNKETNNVTTY